MDGKNVVDYEPKTFNLIVFISNAILIILAYFALLKCWNMEQ